MNKEIQNKAIHQRKNKISFLFLLLLIAMGMFLFSVIKTISSDRHIPSHNTTIYDRSFRGSIISEDGYTLSSSEKTYQAVVRGASIDPDKKALFVKLFSIYSGIPEKKILKRFKNRKGKEIKGNIILSKTINARSAMQLKSLAYKLRKLDVFQSIKTRSGIEVLFGLDIIENGESRRFPLGDVLSPILGYVGDESDGRYTRPLGKKGLERAYEKHITSKKNGYFRGKRDVVGAVIHDKNSIKIQRVDGLDLHLNIPLALQRRVELMIDQMKQSIDADEIIVGVMESKTGKVLSMASSERYDPSHIKQKDIPALVPKFTEYPYEAGSVLKPITVAMALDKNRITPDTWFKTGYKRFDITGGQRISDDDYFESLPVTDIVVHSSNIGTSQISWLLTGKEFREGLLKFGIAQKTGIDLSRDLPGSLKSLRILDHKMHRANSSFGYGMMVTFTQLLKAYSAFNNDGLAVTPRLVDYLQDANGKHYTLPPKVGNMQAVSKKAANQVHDILLEVVKRGTGVKAQYPGLEVGGKTGTAHIAKHGRYVREYHSSFYGFANDKEGHKYTIGALVIRAKKPYKYFASQSAVPTFRRILDILVELDYLKPEGGVEVTSPEIKVEPKTPPEIIQEPIVPQKEKKEKVTVQPVKKATPSVKELFKLEPKAKPKPESKPEPVNIKPAKDKSTHELFEELF
ncbi:penicillin-binding protein [Sulfurovum sp. TSL6]|uniref:penicillin-binding transpeptidase domain-containing protein n=1 Tax=Sulfurovum sp. TSL6 TaxID=2826995 RepID=UPI001CC7AD84|nr:penicillin-binding transpeptidase domain-containing protein [Sulfurovum sp. TSL6]GIU01459.1 penicillin-binding protein [Sulfurovum sp. TSL6]